MCVSWLSVSCCLGVLWWTSGIHSVTGLQLSPCGENNTAEVVKSRTTTFTCSDAASGQQMEWLLEYQNNTYVAGSCPATSANSVCSQAQLGAALSPSRLSATSTAIVVDPSQLTNTSLLEQGVLVCADATQAEARCQLDFIVPASGSCEVHVEIGTSSSQFKVNGSCALHPGAKSSRGRYQCEWYRNQETSPIFRKTLTLDNYQTGCILPPQAVPASPGLLNYTVKVKPGRVLIPAGVIRVEKPSAPRVSDCGREDYIPENTAVNCTCTTDNIGQPAGRLLWLKDRIPITFGDYGDNSLLVSQLLIRSDHDITHFSCEVDWIENVSRAELTFKVGYPPTNTTLTIKTDREEEGNEVTIDEHQKVELVCSSLKGRPIPTVVLEKRQNDGQNVAIHTTITITTTTTTTTNTNSNNVTNTSATNNSSSTTSDSDDDNKDTYQLPTRGSGSVRHVIESARCEDGGVYLCTAHNGINAPSTIPTPTAVNITTTSTIKNTSTPFTTSSTPTTTPVNPTSGDTSSVMRSISVLCSPRTAGGQFHLTFTPDAVSVHLDVIAYPRPHRVLIETLGSSSNGTGGLNAGHRDGNIEGQCREKAGVIYQSVCTVTVANILADGEDESEAVSSVMYRATVINTRGNTSFLFRVSYTERDSKVTELTTSHTLSVTSQTDQQSDNKTDNDDSDKESPPAQQQKQQELFKWMFVGAAPMLMIFIIITIVLGVCLCKRRRNPSARPVSLPTFNDDAQNYDNPNAQRMDNIYSPIDCGENNGDSRSQARKREDTPSQIYLVPVPASVCGTAGKTNGSDSRPKFKDTAIDVNPYNASEAQDSVYEVM